MDDELYQGMEHWSITVQLCHARTTLQKVCAHAQELHMQFLMDQMEATLITNNKKWHKQLKAIECAKHKSQCWAMVKQITKP
jgi:hypothetical protein